MYTVKQLAVLSGVTVRTLHHYDAIGLLKPEQVMHNRYRLYGDKSVRQLRRILFFRELGFPLSEIRNIMDSPNIDHTAILRDQQKLLVLKKHRLDRIIRSLEAELTALEGGDVMQSDDLLTSFGDKRLSEYMREARNRWGQTDAYRRSMEKVKHWSKADYEQAKRDGVAFSLKLSEAMGQDVRSDGVLALIAEHRRGIEFFYPLTPDMYRNLADMYVADPRFTEYYDRIKPGLATWVRDAIHAYCDAWNRGEVGGDIPTPAER